MGDELPPNLGYAGGEARGRDRAHANATWLRPVAKGLCVAGFVVSLVPCVGMLALPLAVAGLACGRAGKRNAAAAGLEVDTDLEQCCNLGWVALALSFVQAAVPAIFALASGWR